MSSGSLPPLAPQGPLGNNSSVGPPHTPVNAVVEVEVCTFSWAVSSSQAIQTYTALLSMCSMSTPGASVASPLRPQDPMDLFH